jgi:hypothetical protein
MAGLPEEEAARRYVWVVSGCSQVPDPFELSAKMKAPLKIIAAKQLVLIHENR